MFKSLNKKTKLLVAFLSVGIVGIGYYLLVIYTPFRIPCVFHLLTGLKCPGCGVSTLLVEASHLNFGAAFAANPFLFVTFPFLVFEIIFSIIRSYKGKPMPKANEILLWIYIGALIIFGILRNILI